MKIDGTGAESLGVTGCSGPVADPAATRLLCVEEPDRNVLMIYGLAPRAPGRRLHTLPAGESFAVCALERPRRSDLRGHVRPTTSHPGCLDGRAFSGKRKVPLREGISGESLLAAACSPDGATQAYSISYTSSRLYLGRGMS